MGFAPTSFELALVMLIISMFGWGSWGNTLKKCGNWRFEAWYFYYIVGAFLIVLFLDLTLGMIGPSTFFSNLSTASISHIFYATLSGIVWNLGNILLVISIVLAGFAFAFPVGVGISTIIGTTLSYLVNPSANATLLFLGVSLMILGIIANSLAYIVRDRTLGKRFSSSKIKKGIILSLITGIVISLFPFLLSLSLTPKGTLDSYGSTSFFTGGALLTAFPFVYLISKLRITNETPVGLKEFAPTKISWYLWGLLAGLVWGIGTMFNFVAATLTGVSIAFPFGGGATLVAAIWGIFVWKELKGAPKSSWILVTLMFAFFVVGLISLALSFK